MNFRFVILSTFFLLLLSCEQQTPPAIDGDSGKVPAAVKDSMRTTSMELPPPPSDEEWFTEPQFNMDSLYARIKYPEVLRKYSIKATATVQVLVDTNGSPAKIEFTKLDNHLLIRPVNHALLETHFTPAYRIDNHLPVAVWVTIPIDSSYDLAGSDNSN